MRARRSRPVAPRAIVIIIAACCGVTVMNIYLAFPLITLFAAGLGVPDSQAAAVAAVSQVGYAIGLFFIIPLGDVIRRKRLLTVLVSGATVGLAVASLAPDIGTLLSASFALSASTVAPQVLIPLVIGLVPAGHRGRAMSTVNVAMLTGIAASRVGAAWLGDLAGWQAVYLAAAVLTATVGTLTIVLIPREPVRPRIPYLRLLASTLALLRTEPRVRWAIGLQIPVFATFNLIWAVMILLLTQPPYSFSVATAGLFGLLGLFPLITAPLMGRLLDARGANVVLALSLVLIVVSMGVMQFSMSGVAVIIVGVALLSVGQQGAGLGNQTRTLTLRPEERSRLNTLYMSSNFLGGSAASGAAVVIHAGFGWPGVTVAALVTSLWALAVFTADVWTHRGR